MGSHLEPLFLESDSEPEETLPPPSNLSINAIMRSKLDTMEEKVNKLMDSVVQGTYSVEAAEELVAADDDLGRGLDLLYKHQANVERIRSLRSEYEANDAKLKNILETLSEVRKDLLATPATKFPPSTKSVPYRELLEYANRISKFMNAPPKPPDVASEGNTQGEAQDKTRPATETGTPAAAALSSKTPPQDTTTTITTDFRLHSNNLDLSHNPFPTSDSITRNTLDEDMKQWLKEMSERPKLSYPSDDMIRRSALATSQGLVQYPPGEGQASAAAAGDQTKANTTAPPPPPTNTTGAPAPGQQQQLPRRESTAGHSHHPHHPPQENPPVEPWNGMDLDLYDPDME
ncbi:MAG: hypothetical protein M1834_009587 [Cirrosporium novae-zelandiae]|nr:MAG: hypothetical protein M1834_009587 [Cirrosporium novae-zelandiae]